MRRTVRSTTLVGIAVMGAALAVARPARAQAPTACPAAAEQAEIRAAAGSSIDALQNAVTFMEQRYGLPHSRKRISDDEIRLIYRGAKGAVSVSLARDETGRIAVDCIAY